MRQAYNYVAVPVLNRLTRPWLRQLCGVEYLAEKKNKTVYNQNTQLWENNPTYDPNYDGEAFDEAELMKTNTIIEEITGQGVTYVRPPYGSWDKSFEKELNIDTGAVEH